MPKYWHISPPKNRPSILEHGLNWELSDPETRLPNDDDVENHPEGWPRGQYLFTDPEQADLSSEDDIWEVNGDGLNIQPDPYLGMDNSHAVYVADPIPPQNLKLVRPAPWDFENGGWLSQGDRDEMDDSWKTASSEDDENLWNITNGDEVFQGKPLDPDDEDPHLFQYVPPKRDYSLDEAYTDLRDGGYDWNIEPGDEPNMWRIQHKRQPFWHDVSSRDLNLKGYHVYYNDPYLPRATGHGAEYNSGHYFLHDTTDPTKSPTRIWATQRADVEGWQQPEPGALNEPYMRERFPDLWQKHWGKADPPDWKSKYNYREAKGPKSCATCSAFKDGECLMFNASAEADMTCDEWSKTWKPKTAADVHDMGNELIGNLSYIIDPQTGKAQFGAPGEHHPDVWFGMTGEQLVSDDGEWTPSDEYLKHGQGNIGFSVNKETGAITVDTYDAPSEEIRDQAYWVVQQWLENDPEIEENWAPRWASIDNGSGAWFNKESNDDQTWQEDGGAGAEAQEAAGAPAGQVEYYWPSPEEAQELSYHAVDNHQGFRDPGGFASAVANARYQQIYGGVSDVYTLAAHLINYVQRQQALVEGNKRTATLLGLWFLEENGIETESLPPEEFGDLVVSMAEKAVTPEQVGEYLKHWLGQRTAMAISPEILAEHTQEHGPFFWHGTHIKNVPTILQHGILPRDQVPAGADAYPWSQHSMPMSGVTYMRNMPHRDAQMYYEKEDEPRSVLFAIDSSKLDPKKIIHDEDNISERWNDESRRLMEEEGMGAGDAFRKTVPDKIEDVDSWYNERANDPWYDDPQYKGKSKLPPTLAYDGPIPVDAIAGLYHQQKWYDPEDYMGDDYMRLYEPSDYEMGFETYAKFVLKADWNDVMAKAKRLIQEGKVTILHNTPAHVMAQVMGDGSDNDGTPDMHEVEFSREDPNSNVITQSVCDCAYNQYRWDRTRPWKKYEGRPCSHILAAYWKSKATPQDIEDAQPGYQVPVGQKGPAAPQGQMKIPGAEPGVTKKDLGFGEGAFGPEGQEGAGVPPPVPSKQQIGIPGQPQNPFAPPKTTPGAPQKNPTPQREQMQLFNLSPEPSTTPPNPAVSVPGATPPTPENPIQLPGTFSHVRRAAVDDEMLQHFMEQQANGEPIYVATTKPQTLEFRGGKHPLPGAQPYDVSTEGVPLYKTLELGYNPETGQRENADVNELSGAPEWRGQYGDVPTNRRGEVRDFDPHLGWAYVHVPLHYPGGEDARLHPHSLAGWVPMSELRVVHPPRTPFRRR